MKTSITLDPETLEAIDELAGDRTTRSRLIETAILDFVEVHRRKARDARDAKILDRASRRLNREIEDVLAFQVEP